jgi:chemotaxis protein methyltransferase CheR
MREPLRRNVHFFHHDLATDHAFGEMQVVFCRNVFIYFDEHLRTRVTGTLAACLCPGGFLCLGKSERLPRGAAKAFAPFAADEHIYRHRSDS